MIKVCLIYFQLIRYSTQWIIPDIYFIQNADLRADTILNFVLQETGINIEIDAMVSWKFSIKILFYTKWNIWYEWEVNEEMKGMEFQF